MSNTVVTGQPSFWPLSSSWHILPFATSWNSWLWVFYVAVNFEVTFFLTNILGNSRNRAVCSSLFIIPGWSIYYCAFKCYIPRCTFWSWSLRTPYSCDSIVYSMWQILYIYAHTPDGMQNNVVSYQCGNLYCCTVMLK